MDFGNYNNCINLIKKPGLFTILLLLIFSSCRMKVMDPDGNIYPAIRIGVQEWTTENLNTSSFRNGDRIPEVRTEEEWIIAGREGKPAWCYYDNHETNGKSYGKLYNYYAVIDPRGLAPEGWHIPSDQEWTELEEYLGGETLAGKKLKAGEGWYNNFNGNNKTKFSAFPGGNRSSQGIFDFLGIGGFWWSSTESLTGDAWLRYLFYGDDEIHKYYASKIKGLSVRCVKDENEQ
jgi:uncharacterized protein (TIGR02145 family)